jgi:hypothetical protein
VGVNYHLVRSSIVHTGVLNKQKRVKAMAEKEQGVPMRLKVVKHNGAWAIEASMKVERKWKVIGRKEGFGTEDEASKDMRRMLVGEGA